MKEEAKIIVVDELEALKLRIIDNIRSKGRNASGRTIQSLRVVAGDDGVALFGRSAFGTMETGRKAGKVPFGFRDIILQWMEDKGISGAPIPYVRKPSAKWQPKYTPKERGDMSLAGAIAATIKKKGSKLHRDGGDNEIYSKEIPIALKQIRERLKGLIIPQVKQVIKLN
jgi:hypothetical protein